MENTIEFANTSPASRAAAEADACRMWTRNDTLKLTDDLHLQPCLGDVQSAEYKIRKKKVDVFDTLAPKYGVNAMAIESKIQASKTQFLREHKKLRDSKRSGSSPNKAVCYGYEPLLFLLQGRESRGSRNTDNIQVSFKFCITFCLQFTSTP
jgi:hypothetical protein